MNLSHFWSFIIFHILIIHFSSGNNQTHNNTLLNPSLLDNHFDVIIFSQNWPQSVCFLWKKKSPQHTCRLPTNNEWTIHGIWPSQFNKILPAYCNKTINFDLSVLANIQNELKLKWTDIQSAMRPGTFWKHEWDRHGTCAVILEKMNTQEKYFQMGLNLFNKYDMKNILAKVNIVPGNSYPLNMILDGIKKILNINAQVTCAENTKTNDILEIKICFDKQLKLTNCDGIYNFPTNCDYTQNVNYPENVPHEVL
ncbi:ribonuclease Oy-like [Leptopilina boulardi]|uniref:ribonuclease Oy-like n=1 Tax=Leptopilina boulardi TaxID=63433 RepID=UPI0021F5FC79|nr:ribonuclease Oy-like [Leptopilina boulardi]